jgi:hypothetical protein
MDRREQIPSFARAYKGNISVLDAMAQALWRKTSKSPWPELSFAEITAAASELAGYGVASSTVRCLVYTHPDLFEKVVDTGRPRWRLSTRVAHISAVSRRRGFLRRPDTVQKA